MTKLKYITLPEGEQFDNKEMNFLRSMDNALEKAAKEANASQFDLVQQQLDKLFLKHDPMNRKMNGGTEERKETAAWIRKFAKGLEVKELEPRFGSYMNAESGLDAEGGYLVPELLLNEIQVCVNTFGLARRHMRYMPFNAAGSTRKIPTESSGVSVEWIDEFELKPLTSISLRIVLQQLKKLAAIAIVTEELLEDTAFDIVGYLARRIGEAIAEAEDRAFFTGTGAPFTGILNVAGTATCPMGVGLLPGDITADHLLNLVYSVPTPARRGAAFYMHSDLMQYIQRLRVDVLAPGDGLGGYLVQMPTDAAPAKLWGYPVYFSDVLPAPDEVGDGDPFMFFGNLERTCFYGDKKGLRVKLLTEASLTDGEGNTIRLAQQDAVALRVFKRTGFVCAMPQCIGVIVAGEPEGGGDGE
jgi:HK97 family phage major capsid protein